MRWNRLEPGSKRDTWFAWHPVSVRTGFVVETVWLEYVTRITQSTLYHEYHEYRSLSEPRAPAAPYKFEKFGDLAAGASIAFAVLALYWLLVVLGYVAWRLLA
jgi:hypothetical protein